MRLKSILNSLTAAAVALAAMTAPVLAADPVPNKGDTAWMLVSTALVLLMTIPGLALFYGGLVRSKNMLSVLMQVFMIVCLVSIIWVLYGYSLTFTSGGSLNAYIGGFSKAFLRGVDANSVAATFSNGVVIPEYAYIAFQMTFACITPALIVGAFAERMKFSALLLFVALWVTVVYFPIAHMVWYWAGPDALADAAKKVAAATGDAKKVAEAALEAVQADAGMMFRWGALDFAGGTVVHINAGIAGLVGALMLGKRVGYGRESMAPHSLTLTMVGAALLWVGWFGFNAGSNLEANGTAALAIPQYVRRHRRRRARLDARRVGVEGQAVAARPRLGRRRRPRRHHAGVGLRRTDGLDRARPHRRCCLLRVLHLDQERVPL